MLDSALHPHLLAPPALPANAEEARLQATCWREPAFALTQSKILRTLVAKCLKLEGSVHIAAIGSLLSKPEPNMTPVDDGIVTGYAVELGVLDGELRGRPSAPGIVANGRRHLKSSVAVSVFSWEPTDTDIHSYEIRELNGRAYIPKLVPVQLRGGRIIQSVLLCAVPSHKGYVGHLPYFTRAAIIATSPSGTAGTSLEYLKNLVRSRALISSTSDTDIDGVMSNLSLFTKEDKA